jgi:hypothetical protein
MLAVGTAMIAAQPVTFFEMTLSRLLCMARGVQDHADQLPQRVGPFGGTQHVVVDVLEVGQQVTTDIRRSRCISAPSTSRIGATTLRRFTRLLRSWKLSRCASSRAAFVEDDVLQALDPFAEILHGPQVVAVDDDIEQAVQQHGHFGSGQVVLGVPPPEDLVHVEAVVLAHGDQHRVGDEGGQLAAAEPAGPPFDGGRVHVHELVGGITVDLGPLPLLQVIFDDQFV